MPGYDLYVEDRAEYNRQFAALLADARPRAKASRAKAPRAKAIRTDSSHAKAPCAKAATRYRADDEGPMASVAAAFGTNKGEQARLLADLSRGGAQTPRPRAALTGPPSDKVANEAAYLASRHGVATYIRPSEEEGPGIVVIDGYRFRVVNCGSSAGADTNMCFYLSVVAHKHQLQDRDWAAVSLKSRLAPVANAYEREVDSLVDFGAPSAAAGEAVVLALVTSEHTPCCVYYADWVTGGRSGVAVYYKRQDATRTMVTVYLKDGHYQTLVPT